MKFALCALSIICFHLIISCNGDKQIISNLIDKFNGAKAPAQTTCYDCFCQCSSLSFKNKYGKIEGNCKSYDKGGRWCYVRDNIGQGYSTCPDLRRSKKFHGRFWSYHACATPTLNSYDCRHCQGNTGHGHGHVNHGRSNAENSKVNH